MTSPPLPPSPIINRTTPGLPFHTILKPLLNDPSNPRGGLYLGSILAVTPDGVPHLRSHNITVLVQAIEKPWLLGMDEEVRKLTCYHIELHDRIDEVLGVGFLDKVTAYIEEKIQCGESVLVHCYMGKSRSASIVIAYMIRYKRVTYDEAYSFVKGIRRDIGPNPSYVKSLRAWAEWQDTQHRTDQGGDA